MRDQVSRRRAFKLSGLSEILIGFGAETNLIVNGPPYPRGVTTVGTPEAGRTETTTSTSQNLYLGYYDGRRSYLYRINRTNPSSSTLIGAFPSGMQIAAMTEHNGEVLATDVSSNQTRLVLVNVSSPGSSSHIGRIQQRSPSDNLNEGQALASHGGRLFCADAQADHSGTVQRALWDVDRNSPNRSTKIGLLPFNDIAWSLADHLGTLYLVAIRDNDLYVANITTPASSRKANNGDLPSSFDNVEAMVSHNGELLMVNDDEELGVINTSNPTRSGSRQDLPSAVTIRFAGLASVSVTTSTSTTIPGRSVPTNGWTLTQIFQNVLADKLTGNTIGVTRGVTDLPDVRFKDTNSNRTLIGDLTIFEDGSANLYSTTLNTLEWLHIVGVLAHCPLMDIRGNQVGMTQGTRREANRTAAQTFSSRDVLIHAGSASIIVADDAVINTFKGARVDLGTQGQGIFRRAFYENTHGSSVLLYGSRKYRYPQWVAGGTNNENVAALAERVLTFTSPRWQEAIADMVKLETLIPGTVHRFDLLGDDGQQLVNNYGTVVRLTYRWRWRGLPSVTVSAIVSDDEVPQQQSWVLGQSRLGVDTILN